MGEGVLPTEAEQVKIEQEHLTPEQQVGMAAYADVMKHSKAYELTGEGHEKWAQAFAEAAYGNAMAEYQEKQKQDVIVQVSEKLKSVAQTDDEIAIVNQMHDYMEVGRSSLNSAWMLEKAKAKRSGNGEFDQEKAISNLYRNPGQRYVHVEQEGRSISMPVLFQSVSVEESQGTKTTERRIDVTSEFWTKVMKSLGILGEGEDIRAIGGLVLPKFSELTQQRGADMSKPYILDAGEQNIAVNLPTNIEGTTANYDFNRRELKLRLTDKAKMVQMIEFPTSQ